MSTVEANKVKSFLSYTEEDLRQGLRPGTYHLKISGAEGSEWDNGGGPRLDVRTQVISGEHANQFGPNHTWSINEFSWENPETGEGFTRTQDENVERLVRQVRFAVHGGRDMSVTDDGAYDVQMMKEIAKQIVNDEFIATVVEDKNGYPKMQRFYSVEKPPKGFGPAISKKSFSL